MSVTDARWERRPPPWPQVEEIVGWIERGTDMDAQTLQVGLPKGEEVDHLMEGMKEQQALASRIEQQSGVPHITAFIMAGDFMSADRALKYLQDGTWNVDQALTLTGSYARLNFAIELVAHGRLSQDALLDRLPDLWRGSDPDDTDPRYLKLWREAFVRNGSKYVRDGGPLPRGRQVRVYRGQMPNTPFGIAWSTDRVIAGKFATGAGTRTPINGRVYTGLVDRRVILAYLTGRGEAEVIVDPAFVE